MKAVVYEKYGPPEVLELREVDKPSPAVDEVLIKIHAATVNRTDCGFRDPQYFIVRIINGLFRPKKKILGSEFSGVIEKTGSNVTAYKPGDKVFGLSTKNFGTHAEYICLPEKGSFALMPENISFAQAAAVCDGLMLAINYIRKIDFSRQKKILVNGASGSIGSAAVQLAKYYGADVTAVCNTKNLELLKTLGADDVIDYTKEDFTQCGREFDIVLDAVGKSSYFKCRKILKPGGTYFSTELGYLWQNVILSIFRPLTGSRRVMFPLPSDSREDILFFKELLERGKYKPVIDRCYPLEKVAEASLYVESEQKTGNVVILIE